jgi:LmbE family N-acetylglucosaminyl deacetylase
MDYFTGFVRPVVISSPFGKSMLVVAPHQDDEAIGCGGALVLQLRSGRKASVVMLHDGADGCEELGMTRSQYTAIRNQESRDAAAAIGMEAPVFFDYESLSASAGEAAARLNKIIREKKVDALFVPFLLDAHPDHRTANFIVAEALKDIDWPIRVLGYEVWGFCIPNVVLKIDEEAMEAKVRMLTCFRIANEAIDYVQSTRGMNMYHSKMLGSGECRYAERFFELPRAEYLEVVAKVRAAAAAGQAAA